MLAFLPTLGFQEMVVLLVIGLLLFGRDLPSVGRLCHRIAVLRSGELVEVQLSFLGDGLAQVVCAGPAIQVTPAAAEAIGMVRQSLQQKIRELGLRAEDWTNGDE